MTYVQTFYIPVLSGVPQGSILGPLLFLLYINDLFPTIQSSHILYFADDTKCFKLIHKDQDAQQLQQDLDSLAKWSVDWNLFFNTNKFIHLSFNTRFTTSYSVNGTPIASTSTHRDLGIIISSNLSWNEHYNSILAKAYRTLGLPSIFKPKNLYIRISFIKSVKFPSSHFNITDYVNFCNYSTRSTTQQQTQTHLQFY